MNKLIPEKIRIAGLTRLDRAEMSDEGKDLIAFENEAMSGSKHGELLTTAVILVTVAGLRILAAYLLRSSQDGQIKKTLEIVNADGSRKVQTIEVNLKTSKAPEADVLKALSAVTNLDLAQAST